MDANLRKSTVTEEFDYNFVIHALSQYKNPRVKINDLLKKGEIIRIKKGLYVFGPALAQKPYSKETLANLIYGPSYISLEYALSFYGLIPEKVETVTSVTNKRKKLFRTPVGVFSYAYINPDLFPHGTTLHRIDDRHTILIATKEKAVCDTLYFTKKLAGIADMETYLFKNLRINRDECDAFRRKKIKELAGMYGHNVSLFYEWMEKKS